LRITTSARDWLSREASNRVRGFADARRRRSSAGKWRAARIVSAGGKPIQRPFGRFVFAADADGVLVEFVERAAKAP
jgi:hypothetical protein